MADGVRSPTIHIYGKEATFALTIYGKMLWIEVLSRGDGPLVNRHIRHWSSEIPCYLWEGAKPAAVLTTINVSFSLRVKYGRALATWRLKHLSSYQKRRRM
jgi:hypothetical protein